MGWVETTPPPTQTADGQADRSSRHGDLVTCCRLLTQHCWLLIGDSYLHVIYTESGRSQRKHQWLCYYSSINNDRIIPLTVWIKIWWYDMTTVGTYGVSCSRVCYRCTGNNNMTLTLPAECRWWISLFYVWKLKIIIRIPAACTELQALSKYSTLHTMNFSMLFLSTQLINWELSYPFCCYCVHSRCRIITFESIKIKAKGASFFKILAHLYDLLVCTLQYSIQHKRIIC